MRKIRILSVVFFILSAGFFVYFKILDRTATDANGPVIQMSEQTIEVSVTAGEGEILSGVSATDEKDGDVTDSLVIESMTKFKERGKRTATIAAFDSDNNVTKAEREIVYSDYTPPVFELKEPLYFPLNTESIISALSASDGLDGNLTQNIKISAEDEMRVNTAGDYQVEFGVSNSAGDEVKIPATVTIYDPSEIQRVPSVSLTDYLIYLNRGEDFDPWSYVSEVSYRGDTYRPDRGGEGQPILVQEVSDTVQNDAEGAEESAVEGALLGENPQEEIKYLTNIEIVNPVDQNTPGVYEVVYKVTADGEYEYEAGTMRLIVVVNE